MLVVHGGGSQSTYLSTLNLLSYASWVGPWADVDILFRCLNHGSLLYYWAKVYYAVVKVTAKVRIRTLGTPSVVVGG